MVCCAVLCYGAGFSVCGVRLSVVCGLVCGFFFFFCLVLVLLSFFPIGLIWSFELSCVSSMHVSSVVGLRVRREKGNYLPVHKIPGYTG